MTKMKQPQTDRAYINVMESVVADKVNQQLQHVPGRIRRYLKIEEIVTYALNRLPTLYASSEAGWRHQCQLAKHSLHREVTNVVRQAIVAVQVDPLRLSQPLSLGHHDESDAVLQALRALFRQPELNWDQALVKLNKLQKDNLSLPLQPAAEPWQPGTHNNEVAWTHRRRRPKHLENEPTQPATEKTTQDILRGWDDPRYRI